MLNGQGKTVGTDFGLAVVQQQRSISAKSNNNTILQSQGSIKQSIATQFPGEVLRIGSSETPVVNPKPCKKYTAKG